jgi:hypothetical protein
MDENLYQSLLKQANAITGFDTSAMSRTVQGQACAY